ncbi:MAG: glutamine amidotransferase [Tissierellia bacterium]|nr:glutamine amidotransferase [Tissierellia bacterium]
MKKTAVLLYETCCLFELTVALEMLRMAEKEVVYFAKHLNTIITEEGIKVVADNTFDELDMEDYDSLLLTGATDARSANEDIETLNFIDCFHKNGAIIGAISIAPIFLLQLGHLKGKSFMIGVEKHNLKELNFTDDDLKNMVGWNDACDEVVPEKYLKTDNIITSVAFGFRQWAMAIGEELGIATFPKSFDL